MENGNDMVKMKDVRDLRMVAANTTEVIPGNPRRDVTDLPQWALTCEVSLHHQSWFTQRAVQKMMLTYEINRNKWENRIQIS
jgi:hypothetical protein